MSKISLRTYSRLSTDAMLLLARLIRAARIEQKITTTELAERAGISRSSLQRIERGDMRCEIGMVFEVATLVGISLFGEASSGLPGHIMRVEEKLALLPKAARAPQVEVKDDF
jgi:DNA-binding XRE family transcriptional regulator